MVKRKALFDLSKPISPLGSAPDNWVSGTHSSTTEKSPKGVQVTSYTIFCFEGSRPYFFCKKDFLLISINSQKEKKRAPFYLVR